MEKIIPVPQSLHPLLDGWLDESNVLRGQPLHPLQHAFQLFTNASNEGWGAHLGDSTARGIWSLPESHLHNFFELKAVFLALKSFEHLCRDQIILVATDNTTVVSYVHKQGGMRSGSLCALLWRLLSWCHPRGISFRARHISGWLNVIADKLSRHNQLIQTEWSLSQHVFNLLCSKWTQPQLDLFATRFNHKLSKFVSPVLDLTAWAVDAMNLSWRNLDAYTFPPVPLPSQVVSKLVDQGCPRMILIAPGWPNMPWFWDLVNLSDSIQATPSKGSGDSAFQRSCSQESQQPEPTCLAPRASVIQEQGFSDEVAARIEAPQTHSTRAVYKSKWAIFVKRCDSNKVDFRSPSVNQIADDFLLHLFKDRNLQQSSIDGYRTAIADMVGNDKLNISKDENLTRLLDSFHIEKPKGEGEEYPPGTFRWYSTN